MPTDIQLTTLFCLIDDFCLEVRSDIEQYQREHQLVKRHRKSELTPSEVITLLLWFHLAGSRDFKTFYLYWAKPFLSSFFPKLPSYHRFIELKSKYIIYLFILLESLKQPSLGIAFVDSTKIAVCHNRRIHQHCVFKDSANRGKTSVDWFYGFKLHLICDHLGRLVSYCMTSGNVDDRQVLLDLVHQSDVKGKLFADRGYIGENWKARLAQVGVELITRTRKNMKVQLLNEFDGAVLKKRGIVEHPFRLMKRKFDLEHSRHRSKNGLLTTILSALILYTLMMFNAWAFGISTHFSIIPLHLN